jgi:hypothetical protein
MIRRLQILGALVVLACSGSAFANHYGMAGCGLGSLVFKDKPGKIQILASTTNDAVSPQTFALTSGTSGCVEGDGAETAALYIRTNKEPLMTDVSRGTGETIVGLSQVLGCSNPNKVGEVLQRNYDRIFANPDAASTEMLNSIGSALKENSETVGTCRILG